MGNLENKIRMLLAGLILYTGIAITPLHAQYDASNNRKKTEYVNKETIKGIVVDEHGKPIKDAHVTVSIDDRVYGTITQKYGHFSLAVPSGEYKVRISHLGYAPIEVAEDDSFLEIILEEKTTPLEEVIIYMGRKVETAEKRRAAADVTGGDITAMIRLSPLMEERSRIDKMPVVAGIRQPVERGGVPAPGATRLATIKDGTNSLVHDVVADYFGDAEHNSIPADVRIEPRFSDENSTLASFGVPEYFVCASRKQTVNIIYSGSNYPIMQALIRPFLDMNSSTILPHYNSIEVNGIRRFNSWKLQSSGSFSIESARLLNENVGRFANSSLTADVKKGFFNLKALGDVTEHSFTLATQVNNFSTDATQVVDDAPINNDITITYTALRMNNAYRSDNTTIGIRTTYQEGKRTKEEDREDNNENDLLKTIDQFIHVATFGVYGVQSIPLDMLVLKLGFGIDRISGSTLEDIRTSYPATTASARLHWDINGIQLSLGSMYAEKFHPGGPIKNGDDGSFVEDGKPEKDLRGVASAEWNADKEYVFVQSMKIIADAHRLRDITHYDYRLDGTSYGIGIKIETQYSPSNALYWNNTIVASLRHAELDGRRTDYDELATATLVSMLQFGKNFVYGTVIAGTGRPITPMYWEEVMQDSIATGEYAWQRGEDNSTTLPEHVTFGITAGRNWKMFGREWTAKAMVDGLGKKVIDYVYRADRTKGPINELILVGGSIDVKF